MKPHFSSFVLAALFAIGIFAALPTRADMAHDLAFTAFSGTVVDTNALAGGQVMQARGPLLDFQRGITAQAIYIIDAAPNAVAQKLITWDPSTHPELKVWTHHPLPLKPTLADFSSLANLPENSSTDYLFNGTVNLNPDSPTLQLDKSEAQLIGPMKTQTSDKKALFGQFWGQVLNGRVNQFLGGQIGAAKYSVSTGDIPIQGDIVSLLRGDSKVYRDFHPLLAGSPFYASNKTAPSAMYFDCFDVEGYGALGTGAVFQGMSGGGIQSADIEYYCNSGIYTTIELEKIFPITVGGKPESLVWREDLVSTANVAYLHGMERLASSMLMLQDVKQGIEAFRAEFK